jgi:prophage regulatory protein
MIIERPLIIRKHKVVAQFSFSKSTLYNRIKDGLIPPPISLGARSVGFYQHEITAVIAAMGAGKEPNEIRELVTSLTAKRQQLFQEVA